MFCDDSENAFLAEVGERVVRQGLVEGVPVEILLDTGSARTLVRKELVPEGKVLGGTMVGVRCAHGEVVHYPIATLEVAVGGKKIAIRAGVSDRLPVQLLLGRDVPELFSLLAATSDSHSVDSVSAKQDVVAVITRAQARRGNVEQVVEDDTSEVGGDESTDFNPGREFVDDLFEGGREKIQLTRLQKRSERRRYAAENKTGEKSKWAVLDMTPGEKLRSYNLRRLQQRSSCKRRPLGRNPSHGDESRQVQMLVTESALLVMNSQP